MQGHHALKPPDPAIVAIEQEMDAVRDPRVVEVERALLGDDGSLGTDIASHFARTSS